ncbi:MAG TPA: FAD-binding oxidoreductase [Ramlibacter sp.]|jgi:CDP-4-dehydro-6-deoxyglucose reductase|uniref:FAD-binding oxidoreductase n=1 Tax=Ramlibacter sp. TaxID=1917967 RepID=UPI002D34AED2|nr:FAD-binding oxidoreductase [Ramlibacter sp.]HZY20346.1 FAD-binding oxidoreductase [Ramlibacter sp.]
MSGAEQRVTLASGAAFDVVPGQSILDAALQAGIVLEHSCRSGRCGSCEGQVLAGGTAPLGGEPALDAARHSAGWVLTCMRTVDGQPVRLAIEPVPLHLPPAKLVPSKIASLERVAPDVLRVRLRLPPQQPLHWRAGQYVDVAGPSGIRRSYSIANRPRAEPLIELHVRAVPGGSFSAYWFGQARPGDLLRLHGPLGSAVLREPQDRPLVLLATGTGIAPVKAMLEEIAARDERERPPTIHVFWGNRRRSDFYWDPAMLPLVQQFTPVLSGVDHGWTGRRGWVQHAAVESGVPLADAAVHACGSARMVDDARRMLVAAGLDPRRFHADAFLPSSSNHGKPS